MYPLPVEGVTIRCGATPPPTGAVPVQRRVEVRGHRAVATDQRVIGVFVGDGPVGRGEDLDHLGTGKRGGHGVWRSCVMGGSEAESPSRRPASRIESPTTCRT